MLLSLLAKDIIAINSFSFERNFQDSSLHYSNTANRHCPFKPQCLPCKLMKSLLRIILPLPEGVLLLPHYFILPYNILIEFRIQSTDTPVSANTASHILE